MECSYKYRIYPNKKQKQLIHQMFGNVRFVWNYYLEMQNNEYVSGNLYIRKYILMKDLTQLKKSYDWLQLSDSTSLQQILHDLDKSFQRYFNHLSEHPKFKGKRCSKQSYRSMNVNNSIAYLDSYIKLPKLGCVKTKNKQIPNGRILNATVSRNTSGKYYVSLCCTEVAVIPYPKINQEIGLDMGLTDFLISDKNIRYKNPKFYQKSLKQLARLQRNLSRKQKGSRNYERAKHAVARCYEKLVFKRQDFLHKISTELVRLYDVIAMEHLDIRNMMGGKNHLLNRNIQDASWSELVRMLKYKCEWYGKIFVQVDTYFPSSQLCFDCGYQNVQVKDLSVRSWDCPICGVHHDRDVNAAKNILREGLRVIRDS